jgi:DNA-binding CsgD family transcriptional regulator
MQLIAQVQRLESSGYSPEQIAQFLGVSEGWVLMLQSTDAYKIPQVDEHDGEDE